MKYFLTMLFTAAIVSGSVYGWQQMKIEDLLRQEQGDMSDLINDKDKEIIALENKIEVLKQQLQKNEKEQQKDSSESASYDIFGAAEFDTEVTGYLKVVESQVPFSDDEEATQDNAYFVITEYKDQGFKKSLEEGIKEGNTVNAKDEDGYFFNLGCLVGKSIDAIQYDQDQKYMDQETLEALLDSSKNKPIRIVMSFGFHDGRGCTCCNLAHQIRLKK